MEKTACRVHFNECDKIVVQHPEFRSYNSPRTGLPASKFGNAYYHLNRCCIETKSGLPLRTDDIIVPDDVRAKLTGDQKSIICKEFGIFL